MRASRYRVVLTDFPQVDASTRSIGHLKGNALEGESSVVGNPVRTPRRNTLVTRLSAVAVATLALALTFVPSASADMPPGYVIGAKVFTDFNYDGDALTLWVPHPCVKNDQIDHWFPLDDFWRNRISSVQGWGECWVWLYRADGSREGPFKGNNGQLGPHINDQTVLVGLS